MFWVQSTCIYNPPILKHLAAGSSGLEWASRFFKLHNAGFYLRSDTEAATQHKTFHWSVSQFLTKGHEPKTFICFMLTASHPCFFNGLIWFLLHQIRAYERFGTVTIHYYSHWPRWSSRQTPWWQHCLNRCHVPLRIGFSTADRSGAQT